MLTHPPPIHGCLLLLLGPACPAGAASPRVVTFSAVLAAGDIPIVVEHLQSDGFGMLRLLWSPAGSKTFVPPPLYTARPPLRTPRI